MVRSSLSFIVSLAAGCCVAMLSGPVDWGKSHVHGVLLHQASGVHQRLDGCYQSLPQLGFGFREFRSARNGVEGCGLSFRNI